MIQGKNLLHKIKLMFSKQLQNNQKYTTVVLFFKHAIHKNRCVVSGKMAYSHHYHL
jgi:hypothetical protein